jgi:hypothetical protein
MGKADAGPFEPHVGYQGFGVADGRFCVEIVRITAPATPDPARFGLLDRSIERALACVVAGMSVLTLGSCGLLMEGSPLSGPMRSPDSTEKASAVV